MFGETGYAVAINPYTSIRWYGMERGEGLYTVLKAVALDSCGAKKKLKFDDICVLSQNTIPEEMVVCDPV